MLVYQPKASLASGAVTGVEALVRWQHPVRGLLGPDLSKPTRTTGIIRELRRIGIEIALDDVGTGHSSLAHLKHLPIDELKIDRSFITQMTDDPRDTAIVESIVTLARNLGLRVVAEGVEREAEWQRLRDVHCTEAQGFLISRPVPAADLLAVLPKRLAA